MLAVEKNLTFQSLFMRHDLMIELGRLECAIADRRNSAAANDLPQTSSLEERYVRISEVLKRLDV
jgi:hypothetical protein